MEEKVNYKHVILQAILTSLGAIVITFLLSLITLESGSISVGNWIDYQGKEVLPVTINNYESNKTLKEVELYFPDQIVSVDANTTYKITSSNNKIVVDIPPKTTESILITFSNRFQLDNVNLNANEYNINFSIIHNTISPTVRLLITMGLYLVTLSIISAIANIFSAKRNAEHAKWSNEKVAQATEYYEQTLEQSKLFKQQSVEVVKELADYKKRLKELRIYYLLRLKDLSKELDFWRDTVRKILYKTDKNAELVIDEVTDTLKTYLTRDRKVLEYDEIVYLANMFKDAEEKGGKE